MIDIRPELEVPMRMTDGTFITVEAYKTKSKNLAIAESHDHPGDWTIIFCSCGASFGNFIKIVDAYKAVDKLISLKLDHIGIPVSWNDVHLSEEDRKWLIETSRT